MITSVKIENLGPLDERTFTLDPSGTTEIALPSQGGKSTLAAAVVWCLTGRLPDGSAQIEDLIHGTAKACAVTLTLADGRAVHRRRLRTGKQDRVITSGTSVDTFTTEPAFAAALGAIVKDADLLCALVLPDVWAGLAQTVRSVGLRDLLAKSLPGRAAADIIKAAACYRSGDPVDEKTAIDKRRASNTARDAAAGAESEAARVVAGLAGEVVTSPTADEVAAAREAIESARAIIDQRRAFDEADRLWHEATARHTNRKTEIAQWGYRAAAVGAEPTEPGDASALRAELAAIVDPAPPAAPVLRQIPPAPVAEPVNPPPSRAALTIAEAAMERATADYRAANTAPASICAGVDASLCCVGTAHAERLAAAKADGVAARAALTDATKAYADAVAAHDAEASTVNARNIAKRAAYDAERAAVEAENRAASEAHTAAVAALAGQRADAAARRAPLCDKIVALDNARESRARWVAAVAALGTKPEPAPEPGERPAAPPDAADVSAARAVIAASESAAVLSASLEARKVAAAERLTALSAASVVAADEAKRLDDLVAAIRSAPAVALRESLSTLGDTGPIAVGVDDAGDLTLTIDELHWLTASAGRRAVSGLILRDCWRRAAALSSVPVVVDDAQRWTEAWPVVGGPVVMLRGVASGA